MAGDREYILYKQNVEDAASFLLDNNKLREERDKLGISKKESVLHGFENSQSL